MKREKDVNRRVSAGDENWSRFETKKKIEGGRKQKKNMKKKSWETRGKEEKREEEFC